MEVAEETAAHRQSTQAHHSAAERGAEERRRLAGLTIFFHLLYLNTGGSASGVFLLLADGKKCGILIFQKEFRKEGPHDDVYVSAPGRLLPCDAGGSG